MFIFFQEQEIQNFTRNCFYFFDLTLVFHFTSTQFISMFFVLNVKSTDHGQCKNLQVTSQANVSKQISSDRRVARTLDMLDPQIFRSLDYQIIRLLDHQIIRLLDHQIIRSLDHQIVRSLEHYIIRSLDCQIIRPLDYQVVRSLDHQIVTLLGNQIFRLLDCQILILLDHQINLKI